jgi:hypothetical protein
MKTPSAFRPVLYLAFLLMFLIYAAVGVGGYVLYGEDASVLITQVARPPAPQSPNPHTVCGEDASVLITSPRPSLWDPTVHPHPNPHTMCTVRRGCFTQDMDASAGPDVLGQTLRFLVLGGITFKLFAGACPSRSPNPNPHPHLQRFAGACASRNPNPGNVTLLAACPSSSPRLP